MNEKKLYSEGDIVEFRVKGLHDNLNREYQKYAIELEDSNHIKTYVYNERLFSVLREGDRVRCKIRFFRGDRPSVEILEYENILSKETVDRGILEHYLNQKITSWDIDGLARLLRTNEQEISFEALCQRWIQTQITEEKELQEIKEACTQLLEDTPILDRCVKEQRELFETRFNSIINQLDYFSFAYRLIYARPEEEDARIFVEGLLNKLECSGTVYRPYQRLNVLSCIFFLRPKLMAEYIGDFYNVIGKRKITHWQKQPFGGALLGLMELFIKDNEDNISKAVDHTALVDNNTMALALQLLLRKGQENYIGISSYRLNCVRLCLTSSYYRSTNMKGLIQMAYRNLFHSSIEMPTFSLENTISHHLPNMLNRHSIELSIQKKMDIDTFNTYTTHEALFHASPEGISLHQFVGAETAKNAILPPYLKMDMGIQIFLNSIPASVPKHKPNTLNPFLDMWQDIEQELFNPLANFKKETIFGELKRGEVVKIIITGIVNNPKKEKKSLDETKLSCQTIGKKPVKGFIIARDIVCYNLLIKPEFFQDEEGNYLVFEAQVLSKQEDGYIFSMLETIKNWVKDSYEEGALIRCCAGQDGSSGIYGHIPGIALDGVSASIKTNAASLPKGESCLFTKVKKGDIIEGRITGIHPGKFLLNVTFERILPKHEELFFVWEAFQSLLSDFAIDTYSPEALEQGVDLPQEEEAKEPVTTVENSYSPNVIDPHSIKMMVHILDRMSAVEDDAYKAYTYLGFARLLCRMVNWDEQYKYITGRMSILAMLYSFANDGLVDEERLKEFERSSDENFINNSVLYDGFHRLRILSFFGKKKHNNELWEYCNEYKGSNKVTDIASLVLTYNLLDKNSMAKEKESIHQRILDMLNYKGYKSKLKQYALTEDLRTEFKTSILYTAGASNSLNETEQLNVILRSINAFLNAVGGTLYIGVNDMGLGLGIENDLEYIKFAGNKDAFIRYITDNCSLHFGLAAHCIETHFDSDNTERLVCIVSIRPYPNGVAYKDRYYIRNGSSNRSHSKEEFAEYNQYIRPALLAQYAPTYVEQKPNTEEEIETAKEEKNNLPPLSMEHEEEEKTLFEEINTPESSGEEAEETTEKSQTTNEEEKKEESEESEEEDPRLIPTSSLRSNILYPYDDNYIEPIKYIRFVNEQLIELFTKYDYREENCLRTLALLEQEKNDYLIIGYSNGSVSKYPIEKLLNKKTGTCNYYHHANVKPIFVTIARSEDAIARIGIDRYEKKLIRVDRLKDEKEVMNLTHRGGSPIKDNLLTEMCQYEIIPEEHVEKFSRVLGHNENSLGELLSYHIETLKKLGIKMRTSAE